MRLFCAGQGKTKPVSCHKRHLCLRKISVVMSVTVHLPQSPSRWLQLSQPEPWFAFLFPSTYSSVSSPPFVHQQLLGSFVKVRGWLQLRGVLSNNKETPLFLIQPDMIHAALFRNRSEHCSFDFCFGRPVFYLIFLATYPYPFYPSMLFCSLVSFQTCVQKCVTQIFEDLLV